jgi:hypothetical protein
VVSESNLKAKPQQVPTMEALNWSENQSSIVQDVIALYKPQQMEIEGIVETPDIAAIVSQTTKLMV